MASLEEKIDKLTAAVEANTAAVLAGGGKPAASGGKAADTAKPIAKTKTKFTAAQVQAAVVNVKDTISSDKAKEIIEEHAGEGAKLAKLTTMPEVFDAVMASCEAAINEAGDGGGEDDI